MCIDVSRLKYSLLKVGRYLFSLNKIINNKETKSVPDSGPCSRTEEVVG